VKITIFEIKKGIVQVPISKGFISISDSMSLTNLIKKAGNATESMVNKTIAKVGMNTNHEIIFFLDGDSEDLVSML